MRSVFFLAVAGLFGALLLGCSAIPGSQPAVTVPVALANQSVDTSANGAFIKEYIDITGDDTWQNYQESIAAYEGINLSMTVTNSTGSASSPADAWLHYYLSDRSDLTANTISAAEPLLDAYLPGGTPELQYDSGLAPLSATARGIIKDGKFYLYAVGKPSAISLDTSHTRLEIKLRINLL